jgi:serine/threonine-protein kinase
MALTPGTCLGAYEIVGLLGAGGMGEVYRARDARLGRDVAIKILPDAFRSDPERVARFQREARALAALNHPNIGSIHGLEETDGGTALILELVEGPTLADRIAQGPLSIDEALSIAKQVADALEAAHEQGVIHRDLKPANVKVRPDGTVKVLDFGLAKALAGDPLTSPVTLTNSPTITSPVGVTGVGMLLGTAAYMSPEQAKGRTADKRSDVWAFGAVLYEMLSGCRAFDGEDVSETLARVLMKEPDWAALPATTPTSVTVVLRRCLQKDRKQRARDIGDVSLALAGGFEGATPATGPAAEAPPRLTRARLLAVAASLLFAGLTGAGVVWILKPLPSRPQPMRFVVPPVARVPVPSPYRDLVFTPDGRHLVYVVGTGPRDSQLMVRPIDNLDAVPLRGLSSPQSPFISPDSRWIAFPEQSSNTLKKVALTGGPTIAIAQMPSVGLRGASWGPDDGIVFATADPATGLFSVPAGGGEPVVLTTPDVARGEGDHVFPFVLPDGKAILFTITPPTGGPDTAQVAALDMQTGRQKTLIRGGAQAEYVAPVAGPGPAGFLVYAAAGALRAVRFDPVKLEVLSDPVPVIDDVLTKPSSGAAEFSVSRTGALVYFPRSAGGSLEQRSLMWVTRQGLETPLKAPPGAYENLQISPDERRIAVSRADQQRDIWIWDIAREILTRLTLDPAFDGRPFWTPDGQRIIYTSDRNGSLNLYRQASDNTGTVERLTTGSNAQLAWGLSPDGNYVLFSELAPHTRLDLLLHRLDGTSSVRPLLQTRFVETDAALSADGRWLTYQSDESGQNEIHVRPFPNVDGGHWQVSSTGGAKPIWAPSGRELFYLSPTNAMMAVSVQANATFTHGTPRKLFDTTYFQAIGRQYDVSRDGQRFLMIKEAPRGDRPDGPAHMVVVLNWLEELARLVPTN